MAIIPKTFLKGIFRLVPILIALAAGYLLCVIIWLCGWKDIMSFSPIADAAWLNIPYGNLFDISDKTNGILGGIFDIPYFSIAAILAIAPVALVTFMEHIGDITTNSIVCGQDFAKDPGLHRTMLGDGLATAVAGFFGGPSNTTYSENTGVLATTKNYNPAILRLTAVWAILLGFIGKFGGFLQTIPAPVKGGVEIILFGMIASIGVRTLIESKLNFQNARNLIIVALILVIGIGMTVAGGIPLGGDVELSGLFVATIVGVIANLVLPKESESESVAAEVSSEAAQEHSGSEQA